MTMRSIAKSWITKTMRATGCLLAVSGMLAVLAPGAQASSAVERWAKGDWWDVQLEQQGLQTAAPEAKWLPSFRLRFEVISRSSKEVRVEVHTQPQNRFGEHLVLRYAPKGALLSAQVVSGQKVSELGPAGEFGVFGMLGREAFDVAKAPAKASGGAAGVRSLSGRLERVAMDRGGRLSQSWRAGEKYWTAYESSVGVPQRATLAAASWKAAGPGSGSGR
jgi:hypothetical protein